MIHLEIHMQNCKTVVIKLKMSNLSKRLECGKCGTTINHTHEIVINIIKLFNRNHQV